MIKYLCLVVVLLPIVVLPFSFLLRHRYLDSKVFVKEDQTSQTELYHKYSPENPFSVMGLSSEKPFSFTKNPINLLGMEEYHPTPTVFKSECPYRNKPNYYDFSSCYEIIDKQPLCEPVHLPSSFY